VVWIPLDSLFVESIEIVQRRSEQFVLEIADALQASASVHMKYNKMTIHNRKFSFLIRVYKSDVSEQITSVICGFAAFLVLSCALWIAGRLSYRHFTKKITPNDGYYRREQ